MALTPDKYKNRNTPTINENAKTKKKDDPTIKRTTVETSREYHAAIKTYCFQNDLRMVDFLRDCLQRGFEEIKKERGL